MQHIIKKDIKFRFATFCKTFLIKMRFILTSSKDGIALHAKGFGQKKIYRKAIALNADAKWKR